MINQQDLLRAVDQEALKVLNRTETNSGYTHDELQASSALLLIRTRWDAGIILIQLRNILKVTTANIDKKLKKT